MFAWSRNSRSTSGYCGFGCIYFCYFNILYVFEVVESVSCSFAKLPCPDDLGNPNQLPVSQVLEDTDDWVLWIFVIFSLPTFSGSKNAFLAVSQSYCSGDLKNPGQLPVWQVLEGTDDWVLWIFVISSLPTFLGSRNPFLAVSQSYYVRVTSKNPGQLPVSQVLEGTDDWVLWNFVISSLPTFLGSRNPFLAVSQSYFVWVISKILVNFWSTCIWGNYYKDP